MVRPAAARGALEGPLEVAREDRPAVARESPELILTPRMGLEEVAAAPHLGLEVREETTAPAAGLVYLEMDQAKTA